MNLKDPGRAPGATDFPTGLLQHIQNMSPLDLFKRRSIGRWLFLSRHLRFTAHTPCASGSRGGDRDEVGNLWGNKVRPQR